jgi:hypothetical protein
VSTLNQCPKCGHEFGFIPKVHLRQGDSTTLCGLSSVRGKLIVASNALAEVTCKTCKKMHAEGERHKATAEAMGE